MTDSIFPLQVWPEGIAQASVPANENALREEALRRPCLGVENSVADPDDGALYIVGDTPADDFSTFAENELAFARVTIDGTSWHHWQPTDGLRVWMDDGSQKVYVGGSTNEWQDVASGGAAEDVSYDNATSGLAATNVQDAIDELAAETGGSTQGKQAIYVSAAAMRPSVSGGCATLAAIATSANQPDILTLDFDKDTDEFAQFGLVMPKKWNAGTMTARFHWTHGATTTNFAVVWGLQAVAVSNDDAIGAAYGTAVTVTDTGGTTNDFYTSDESSAMTAAGSPAKEDMVYFRVYRDADAGGDTLAVDAKLIGVTLYVTTDADTDA